MKNLKLILAIFVLCVVPAAAQQQINSKQFPPYIQTSGESVIMAKPDRVQIDIGVITEAPDSQTAVAQNAEQSRATISKIRQMIAGGEEEIKTISYTVSPRYNYPKDGGEPTLTGFTATNIVRVTLDDLTKIGRIIDAAVKVGANQIQNLQFMLKDEQAVQQQALRDATIKARRKAEAIASALNVKIIRVLSVIESGPAQVPVRDVAYARAQAVSTPIEPGAIEVRASVIFSAKVHQSDM